MTDISLKALDGPEFAAYQASPQESIAPGLIVIHEIFGINQATRDLCDAFARQGYFVVCPDLFWRIRPGASFDPESAEDWPKAFDLYKKFDIEAGVRDLLATLAAMRRMKGCNGVVGTYGISLGGKMAYLMAARSDVDCSVSVTGMGVEAMLDEVYDVRMPLMMFVGAQDKFMMPAVRQRVATSLGRNPVIRTHIYENAGHAFTRTSSQGYDAQSAADAGEKTKAFLYEYLRDKKHK